MIELQVTWGWQEALYLFLGGLGSGIFSASGAVHLLSREGCRRSVSLSFWIAAACLAVGLLVLVSGVTNPIRALLIWRSFTNEGSWMALGAWGAMLALVVFSVTAWLCARSASESLVKALVGAGIPLALFLSFYTGMLLKGSAGVPFWGSWLLPCLFLVSALGGGASVVFAILSTLEGEERMLDGILRWFPIIILAIAGVEAILLFLHLDLMVHGGIFDYSAQRESASFSAMTLLSGAFALPFWVLVVVCGLALPCSFFLVSCFRGKRCSGRLCGLAMLCTLVGELSLRCLFLYAGASADYAGVALSALV